MSGGFGSTLKRFILWDYARGSWQYDVMVGLILLFIFATPPEWFRDQPRPKNVAMLPAEQGMSHFFIEPGLLDHIEPSGRMREAERLVRSQTDGRNRTLVKLEPIWDDDKELKGYLAFTRP